MKKIMIVERDDGKGRELAQWLGTVFPECEIHVLKAVRAEGREGEKRGLDEMRTNLKWARS